MSESAMPTPGGFLSRMRLVDTLVAVPAAVVIIFYNGVLLDLSRAEWAALGWTIAVYAVVVGVMVELGRRRSLDAILYWLAARAHDEVVDSAAPAAAFRAVVAEPRTGMLRIFTAWTIAPPLIAMGMWFGTDGDVGFDWRFFALVGSSVLGAMISGAFLFFVTKRALTDVRLGLAAEIPDADERAGLVVHTSLARKVQYVVVGAVIGTSLLIVTIAQFHADRALEAEAISWQQRMLTAVDRRVREQAMPFDDAVAAVIPDADLLPHAGEFYAIERRDLAVDAGPIPLRVRRRIAESLAASEPSGAFASNGAAAGVVTWRAGADGRVLLSVVDSEQIGSVSTGLFGVLIVAVVLSSLCGLAIAFLMGDDFRRAIAALSGEAERLAAGDLTRGRVWESEDEMGGLGRAFERMGDSLRATVGRVSQAADRVDVAAADISTTSQSVAVASADQVRRIQQANELMVQIKEQVGGVSDSAQALNVSVEESSSSILELGAAGDELNDTASVLSSKVDEVSGSIEQMVRSVKQVGTTTEGLSDAAAETSSSMEEMASAMRAVDNTAALTAQLSTDVVSLSESGQRKVSETISGMEAIRDATDAAENVIRGLGSRAKEIGGILDVIDDVADETNLLALNAAIIAAQAGEHGRAFSVVADEIKELADRVLASTKEIGGLIRSVQAESDNAVGAIEVGSASVATGVEQSAEAGAALEEIMRAARESGDRIEQIVGAVREQTKATAHVAGLMEGVSNGVEQISTAGAEQDRANEVVYRSAVTMREVAQQVRRTTEEQSRGFSRIRESVEGVREAVENIDGSLQEQSTACSQVASFLEQVFDGTRSNEEAAQRMGTSMRDLLEQAEALREDVAKFRI